MCLLVAGERLHEEPSSIRRRSPGIDALSADPARGRTRLIVWTCRTLRSSALGSSRNGFAADVIAQTMDQFEEMIISCEAANDVCARAILSPSSAASPFLARVRLVAGAN